VLYYNEEDHLLESMSVKNSERSLTESDLLSMFVPFYIDNIGNKVIFYM
jgi:hypothetical protein